MNILGSGFIFTLAATSLAYGSSLPLAEVQPRQTTVSQKTVVTNPDVTFGTGTSNKHDSLVRRPIRVIVESPYGR